MGVSVPSEIAVVIPCFNEGKRIERLVTEVKQRVPTLIVVDDGSTDETAERAQRAGAFVIRQGNNRGKGTALATGLKYALEKKFIWAMTMDGDGQHSPEDIPQLIGKMNKEVDLIVGNRMQNPRGMPLVRRLVNRWMSRRISNRAGQPLPDSQCGFRLFRLETWSHLALETNRFEVESEMLLAFAAAQHRIAFVPIRVIYGAEQSKIHPLKDAWRWWRWWRKAKRTLHFTQADAPPVQALPLRACNTMRVPK